MNRSLIIFFCVISPILIFSQNSKNYKFYHLNTKDNLSQNTVHAILQDKQGFMWFGTDGGLNRWNGYRFAKYIHDSKDSTSIGQGRINCITEDKNGTLWIGTFQDGISQYNKETNNFTNYKNKTGESEDQRNNVFQIINLDDIVIYGTFGKGLYKLDAKSKISTKIQIFNQKGALMEKLVVQNLVFDADSNLWIGHSQGLLKVSKKDIKNNFTSMHSKSYLEGNNVEAISVINNSLLLIGTQFNGIFYYSRDDNDVKPYILNFNEWPEINKSSIRDFLVDKYNNLWIATDGNGIFTVNNQNKSINHYQNELNNYFTLSSDNIYCLYKDKKNNIWIGTYNTGINYINYYKQSFNHSRGFGKDNELNNNAVLSFCELPNHEILIGTDGGGINIYNRKDEAYRILNLPTENESTKKQIIVCMVLDDNKLYIGTYLFGLYIYDLHTKTFKNYRSGNGKFDLKNNNIWSIAIDNKKQVWLASLGNGLFRFNQETEKFYNYTSKANQPNSISDNYISNLCIDNKNNLWVGTFNNGINILMDEEKGIFKSYKRDIATGLSSNDIWKIFEDYKKNIWIATQDGGLCLMNKDKNRFQSFTIEDGLPSNAIKSIVEDKNHNLWLGTNGGIVKFKLENNIPIVKTYNQQDGLQGNEFNFGAIFESQDNYLFFGGNNGFNYFHPDSLLEGKDIGTMVIEDISVLYHDNYTGESVSVLKNKADKKVILDYNPAIISIEYSLLDFTVPELNSYDFMLEGFDKNWNYSNKNNKVTYTNLDPGEYIFKVKGINSLGYKTNEPTKIKIIITPPFWAKIWFKVTLFLTVFLLILLVYNLRLRSYNRHEKLLKKAVKERTEELVSLNKVLADRNNEIENKSQQLKIKSENLGEVNKTLEKSKKQIELQNIELEKHRNNLELLVEARTKELEMAKAKAIQSEQLKMAFLANMSHEIRTPMNAIVGFSSLLSMEGYSQEERRNFTELINSNSNTLLLLIDDILDLSRLEANQLVIKKEKVDIVALLNEIIANWKVIHKGGDEVKFEHINEITHESLIVKSDKSRIKQIINNLIDNAFKFTNKGKVSIHTKFENDKIIVKISDTGIGIEKGMIPIIFNRFTKNDESDNKNYRGAGLGLAISKKLAILLNGKLRAESVYKEGSDFYFELPI